MFSSNPEYAAEVSALADLLKSASISATVSYRQMSVAIGRDVQKEARISLLKARKLVEKETGARFETVIKVGVKRLAAHDLPGIGTHSRRRIGALSRRAYARLMNISNNDITPEIERRLHAERAHLGAIALVSKETSHVKIEDAVRTVGAEIPAAKVLGMFVTKTIA